MTQTFDDMVKITKRKFFKLSIEDLREHMDDNWVKEKIRKYHIRTGLDTTHIKSDIIQNDFVASLFCKNPTRCNLAERLACDILGVERLPQRGKDAVRFDENGNISCQRTVSTSKAADCYFDGTYYTLKYTEGTGGAQDNQMQDVYTFLRNGSKRYRVGAILDGSFWEEHRQELVKAFSSNPRVVISSMGDKIREEEDYD